MSHIDDVPENDSKEEIISFCVPSGTPEYAAMQQFFNPREVDEHDSLSLVHGSEVGCTREFSVPPEKQTTNPKG